MTVAEKPTVKSSELIYARPSALDLLGKIRDEYCGVRF